jgi:hypothetical protein
MTDEDIAKAVAEDPDAAPFDIDWTQAHLANRQGVSDPHERRAAGL